MQDISWRSRFRAGLSQPVNGDNQPLHLRIVLQYAGKVFRDFLHRPIKNGVVIQRAAGKGRPHIDKFRIFRRVVLLPCGGRVQFLFNNNSNANNNVSMPCGGLISFLQPGKKEVFPMNMLCQCPTSGFSHFYTAFEIQISQLISVSMPYIGLLPFLRYSRGRCCDAYHFVSMPYIGLLPFLPGSAPVSSVSSLSLCQCPTSGFSHFYSTL